MNRRLLTAFAAALLLLVLAGCGKNALPDGAASGTGSAGQSPVLRGGGGHGRDSRRIRVRPGGRAERPRPGRSAPGGRGGTGRPAGGHPADRGGHPSGGGPAGRVRLPHGRPAHPQRGERRLHHQRHRALPRHDARGQAGPATTCRRHRPSAAPGFRGPWTRARARRGGWATWPRRWTARTPTSSSIPPTARPPGSPAAVKCPARSAPDAPGRSGGPGRPPLLRVCRCASAAAPARLSCRSGGLPPRLPERPTCPAAAAAAPRR